MLRQSFVCTTEHDETTAYTTPVMSVNRYQRKIEAGRSNNVPMGCLITTFRM